MWRKGQKEKERERKGKQISTSVWNSNSFSKKYYLTKESNDTCQRGCEEHWLFSSVAIQEIGKPLNANHKLNH